MAFYEPVIRALNEAQVRYVVVGGLAVVLHGYARFTTLVSLGGATSARIAAIPDLIRMKEAVGRPQDIADIEALRVIEQDRRDG